MTGRPRALAFIDESGQRAMTAKSSDYFILSGVVLPEDRLTEAHAWLAGLKSDLRRQPHQVLHWVNYQAHGDRLRAAQMLGSQRFARVLAVVACKRHLGAGPTFTEDHAYMFAFRLLLERMSWLAQRKGLDLHYTLGHVRGFSKAQLREYEARLRVLPPEMCKIAWDYIAPEPSEIERPEKVELLQMADVAASAIGAAFNPDSFGNTEQRYIQQFAGRFDRGRRDAGDLASYGLKMLPWQNALKAAHPWVAAL